MRESSPNRPKAHLTSNPRVSLWQFCFPTPCLLQPPSSLFSVFRPLGFFLGPWPFFFYFLSSLFFLFLTPHPPLVEPDGRLLLIQRRHVPPLPAPFLPAAAAPLALLSPLDPLPPRLLLPIARAPCSLLRLEPAVVRLRPLRPASAGSSPSTRAPAAPPAPRRLPWPVSSLLPLCTMDVGLPSPS